MTSRPKTQFIKIFAGLIVLSLLCWAISFHTRLLRCESKSLGGLRYLFILKGISFKRGDIIFIQSFATSYRGKKLLAKRIMGLPGDLILKSKTKLRIITKNTAAPKLQAVSLPLLQTTREGQLLTPLSKIVIPEGYAFVTGDHPRSFDSRYAEFGLVPFNKIWGKAVWAW